MEQLRLIENFLQLSNLPNYYHYKYGQLTNARILLIILAFMTFFNSLGSFYPTTVLLLALLYPFVAKLHDEHLQFQQYFPVLAVYLWIRLCSTAFIFIDGIMFVMLWHPNSRWAEVISRVVMDFIKGKRLGKQSLSDKIGNKFRKQFTSKSH